MRIYASAIAAVDPRRLVAAALRGELPRACEIPQNLSNCERIRMLAVGKAARGMALGACEHLRDRITDALIIERRGASRSESLPGRVMAAAHPTPDESSEAAGRAALDFARETQSGELLLFLLSGGASSLLAVPADGIGLKEKVAATSALMRTGASIRELNIVRKHLSAIKGGGLLRVLPRDAQILSLILSDVPGNDLATIGSGPAAPDPTTFADAIAVLKRRKLWGRIPETVRDHLERGNAGEVKETLKPSDTNAARATSIIIGDNQTAQEGAARAAGELGYAVELGGSLTEDGEVAARELSAYLARLAWERTCLIAGGEPTVAVRGAGRGGRATHCALVMAQELDRLKPARSIAALFAGTDGTDGPTDAAGAIVSPSTIARSREAGLDSTSMLARCDSYPFFAGLGDLVVTGPTGTNVTDIFIGLAVS